MNNQFKVGDWVTIEGTLPNDRFQLTENEIKYKEILLAHFRFGDELWKLWQPKPNEWVWHKLLGNLCQYKGPVEDSDLFSFYVPNFNHPIYSVTCASTLECEPYLGALPSYLKH